MTGILAMLGMCDMFIGIIGVRMDLVCGNWSIVLHTLPVLCPSLWRCATLVPR